MGEFLTLDEAANKLGISNATLQQWIKRGWARASRRGGAHWMREREVERLLRDGPQEGEPEPETPVVRVPPPPPVPPSLPEEPALPVSEDHSDRYLTSRRERVGLPRALDLAASGERAAVARPVPDPRLERLERDLEAVRAERDEARAEVEQSRLRARDLQEQVEGRERELADLHRQLEASLSNNSAELEEQLGGVREEANRARSSLRAMTAECERLQAELNRVRDEQSELEAARGRIFGELETTRTDLERTRSEMLRIVNEREKLQGVSSRVRELEQQLADARAESDGHKVALGRAQEELRRLGEQGRVEADEARVLASRVQELEQELAREQADSRRLEVEYDRVRNEFAARRPELDEVENLREDLRALQKTALKLETERSRLINESATLRTQAEDALRRVEVAEERRSRVEEEWRNQKARYEEELRQLGERFTRAQSRVETLENHLQLLDKRQEDRNAPILEENRRLKDELKGFQRASAEGARAGAGADDANAKARLSELESAMSEKDRMIEDAYRDRSEIRSQLEAYKQHYYELQQRYEREKTEWSALVAHEFQRRGNETLMQQQSEAQNPQKPKGWGLFRPRSDT